MKRPLLIVAGAALLLTVPASAERGSTSAFLGMARPSALALVDANGDGKTDIVSANVRSSVSYLSGAGDGTLGGSAMTPLKGGHPDLASADFNGDQIPDYVVANYEGSIGVFLGNSSGVGPMTNYPSGQATIGALAGDFNRDGKIDIAGVSAKTANVTVRLGNGDGTFGAQALSRVGGNPWEAATADLNRDGNLDILATTGLPDELRVLFGTGTGGTFVGPRVFTVGDLPTGIATGDFNGDGQLDVALASFGEDFVTVLLGDGNGGFRSSINYRAIDSPDSIIAADFTGDGKLDLAAATFLFGKRVAVLQGRGDGTFGPPGVFQLAGPVLDLEAADLNGDGKLDLVGANPFDGHVSVLLGQAGGAFARPAKYAAGPPVCVVFDLRRKTVKQAKALLKSGNCRVGRVRSSYSPKVRRGRVIKQRPAPGSELPLNSRVTLTISRGPKR
jgi:PASTA domain-containing protein/VCBS repeat protein